MIFRQVPVGTFQNFAYVIGDDTTKIGAVVDPAWEVDKLVKMAQDLGLKISFIINTHSHHDHIEGNAAMAKRTGAKVVMHRTSGAKKDLEVEDGDIIDVGNLTIRVFHTPGHCPDHICLLVEGKVLTGDTLFVGECGRTDLAGGDANQMHDSLNKLLELPDSVEVYPGHDYGREKSSTIGKERKTNYTLKKRSREEFVKFMAEP